jgi:hypothetical protein
LHILVIFTCLGLVAGTFVWRIVYRNWGVRGMLFGRAFIGSCAAVLCIVGEAHPAWSQVWIHGVVFMLATIANQAIFTATISWINVFAADHHRATLIGFGALLVAIEAALVGAVLGGLAEMTSAGWPVAMMLVLNLIAAVVAIRAPARI